MDYLESWDASDDAPGEDGIVANDLAVGLTRPATLGGVPVKPLLCGVFVVLVVFLAAGNPFYLLTAVPMYLGLRLLSAEYPRIFAEIAAWLRVNARCNNRVFWRGAASFSPRRAAKWESLRWA